MRWLHPVATEMLVNIADADPVLFDYAVYHLTSLGASELVVFKDHRQAEGPWLTAFVILDGRRHVRWTGDSWQGQALEAQAHKLAKQLEAFEREAPHDWLADEARTRR